MGSGISPPPSIGALLSDQSAFITTRHPGPRKQSEAFNGNKIDTDIETSNPSSRYRQAEDILRYQ